MVFLYSALYLLETTGHNMKKENKKTEPQITQKGKSTKDYLILKEWEAARERSLKKAEFQYYKIKD